MKKFTIRETNIAKGVACILLLLHHLFYNKTSWGLFYHMFGREVPLISFPAKLAKVCVAIFLILSGYGLTKSTEKSGKTDVPRHLLKLYMNYWFIFLIFVPLGFLFGRNPIEVYAGDGSRLRALISFATNFLGISRLLKTPTMNSTWWYMGAIIPFYILFPLLYRSSKRLPIITLLITFVLCIHRTNWSDALLYWLFPFTTGIVLADKDILNRLLNLHNIIKWLIIAVALVGTGILRMRLRVKADTFFGLSIILFSVEFFGRIKYVDKAMEFIGKHSGNIFMFHTFLYYYYFRGIIYKAYYPILILLFLLAMCLVISVGLEKLKVILRYDRLEKKIIKLIDRR